MSARQVTMEAIAILCGALIGLLAVNALHWLFADGDFFALTLNIGRIVTVLVTVTIYAVWYHHLSQTPAALLSFFTGLLLPSVIVLFSYDVPLQTTVVLLLYTAFAIVSLLVYRFVLTKGIAGQAQSTLAGH